MSEVLSCHDLGAECQRQESTEIQVGPSRAFCGHGSKGQDQCGVVSLLQLRMWSCLLQKAPSHLNCSFSRSMKWCRKCGRVVRSGAVLPCPEGPATEPAPSPFLPWLPPHLPSAVFPAALETQDHGHAQQEPDRPWMQDPSNSAGELGRVHGARGLLVRTGSAPPSTQGPSPIVRAVVPLCPSPGPKPIDS